jgi:hypothetical protein
LKFIIIVVVFAFACLQDVKRRGCCCSNTQYRPRLSCADYFVRYSVRRSFIKVLARVLAERAPSLPLFAVVISFFMSVDLFSASRFAQLLQARKKKIIIIINAPKSQPAQTLL